MPIVAVDIEYRLSGGASNSNANAALGGVMSSTIVPAALFDDKPSAEATPGRTEYRCIYVYNDHATLSLLGAVLWIVSNTPPSDTEIAVGLAVEGLNADAATVASETTAPAGVTFQAAATEGAGLALGNLPAGQRYAVWVRCTVNAGAAVSANPFQFRVAGDTAP